MRWCPTAPTSLDAEHVDEERGELVRARGKLSRAFRVRRIVGQQRRRLVNHHVATRAGRDDDRHVAAIEDVHEVTRHRAGVVERAGIEGRLAAAGLSGRDVDLRRRAVSSTFTTEKPTSGKQAVDEARDEQLDSGGTRAPAQPRGRVAHVRSFVW